MKDVFDCEGWRGPAVRRLLLETFGATAIYSISVSAAMLWLRFGHPVAPWRYLIAALPVLPALLIPAATLRYIRISDELQKKIYMDGFAFAFLATAVLTLTAGLMENAGLPRLSWMWIWPVMAVCWTIGLIVANRRYK